MSNNTNASIATESTKVKLNAKELVFKYLIYLPLFILTIAISIISAYTYIRYQIPIYNSSISLLITDEKNGGGNVALEDLVMNKKRANLANEIEVLKSASLMDRVVRALKANVSFYSKGKVKTSELYLNKPFEVDFVSRKDTSTVSVITLKFDTKGRFQVQGLSNQWHSSGELIKDRGAEYIINVISAPELNPDYVYSIVWQPTISTAEAFSSALKISQLNREASILKIGIDTEVPEKGRDILNQLVKTYNISTIDEKNRVTESTVRFIDSRLILLTSELGQVEGSLQGFRQKNEVINMEAQGTQQFSQLQLHENSLNDQEVRLQVIDMIRSYVGNPAKQYTIVPSSLGIEDPTLTALVADYNRLQLEREEQLRTIPEANPTIQGLEGQIERVRVSILENLNTIKRSAESLRNRLLSEYNQTKGQIRTIPSKERELLEIARQQGIKEKLYLFLLQKREESAITMAANVANSYPLDPAKTIGAPVSPNTTNIYRLYLFFGILIPFLFIYLRDLLNDKITTRTDLTNGTSVPLIGEVAHHKTKDRRVIIGSKDRSIISEQFRMIRTNLQYFTGIDKNTPVLMVTSSTAGEGKTFSSMNIAAVYAVASKRTVILELDLRKPKISESLNLINVKGITNYLVGHAKLEELPVLIEGTDNLYVVPAGPIPPNPAELMLIPKMDELFAYLKANFDLVIIDSAPVGLVSDAKVLSKYADATVYIVRQRYTLKRQLAFINELYNNKTLPSMSILVNDVKLSGASSYNSYGYGANYGYGYTSYGKEEKLSWTKKLMNFYK